MSGEHVQLSFISLHVWLTLNLAQAIKTDQYFCFSAPGNGEGGACPAKRRKSKKSL